MRSRIAVAVLLVFGVVPAGALADEGDTPMGSSSAQLAKVELLADFAVGEGAHGDAVVAARESVTALRDQGIGWGALFMLQKLASILGVNASDLMADGGETGEFNFGELRKTLTPDQLAEYEAEVKNFGQLKKASKDNIKDKVKVKDKTDRVKDKADRVKGDKKDKDRPGDESADEDDSAENGDSGEDEA